MPLEDVDEFGRTAKDFWQPDLPWRRAIHMVKKTAGEVKELVPGQKAMIASQVSYQAGSVVSRTIIHDRAGTVTLFAFDEGEGLSEHTAPYNALLHLLEGEAEVTIAGNRNLMEQGEAIILPAGKPHAVQALKKCKVLLTMIRSK